MLNRQNRRAYAKKLKIPMPAGQQVSAVPTSKTVYEKHTRKSQSGVNHEYFKKVLKPITKSIKERIFAK